MPVEINNKTKAKIDLNLVEKIAEKFLKIFKIKNKDVSIAFIGDAAIKKINYKYRKINAPTDVLSFEGEDNFLGEILINYKQIKKQAKEYGRSARQELAFILVHGLLHLIGYDDKSEKEAKEMEKLGNEFIKKL